MIADKNHAVIVVENLNVGGMTQNHKIAKSMSDASVSSFLLRTEQKCIKAGKTFIKVDRFYPSSQLCSVCGYKNTEVKNLDIREWEGPVCHAVHDRDFNASLNLRHEGFLMMNRVPVDGGKVTPVEIPTVDDRAKAPKKQRIADAGIVLKNTTSEAQRL